MDTFSFIDIYATKGIEYLIVITFLISLVAFQKLFVAERGVAAARRKGWLSFLRVRPHLSEMRWNPVMSYMKHPEKDDKTADSNTPDRQEEK